MRLEQKWRLATECARERELNSEKEELCPDLTEALSSLVTLISTIHSYFSLIPISQTTGGSGLGMRQSTFYILQEIQGVWVVRSMEEATLPVPHSGAHHAERWLSA